MCPVCLMNYLTSAALVAGSTGALAMVVAKVKSKVKGESK